MLRTNEVLVYLNLMVLSRDNRKETNPSGETFIVEETSKVIIRGTLAGRMLLPTAGKREIQLYRRLPGSLIGSLTESYSSKRDGIYGEGGLSEFRNESQAEWSHPGVDLSPPRFDISLDLDAATWTLRNPSSGINGLIPHLIRGFSYSASRYGPDDNGEYHLTTTSNPDKALIDGPPAGNPKFANAALLVLEPILTQLEAPQTLVRRDDSNYSGSFSPREIVQDGKVALVSLVWGVTTQAGELELQVTSPDLEEWRPTAKRTELGGGAVRLDPGDPLELIAKVVRPGGPDPAVLIRKLRWWLEDTSQLPGIAMNSPYAASDTDPDLFIDHPNATQEGQQLEVTGLTTLKHKVRIKPFDWGGWSTLRVEAELDDGRKLQGILPGQSGDKTAIRLPAREEDSKVSSAWKRRNGLVGMADDSDLDGIPAGGPDGDGFTLFEEYRGFYGWRPGDPKDAPAVHLSTNPEGKTVFIYDRIKDGDTQKGISLFQSASRAYVFLVRPGTRLLDDSRIMNRNTGNAPTKGPQRAIGLRPSTQWLPRVPGSPGTAEVGVPAFESVTRTFPTLASPKLYQRAIAKSMLMACRVPLPGARDSGDGFVNFTYARDPEGKAEVTTDKGEIVRLLDEATGRDLGEEWLRSAETQARTFQSRSGADAPTEFHRGLYVAVRGGPHSGPLANIMRSAHAQAYRIQDTDIVVVLTIPPAEVIGEGLPTTSAGDGYNAPDNNPRHPRYGSSLNPAPRGEFNVSDRTP
jgi:hypothetical protein